MVYAAQKSEGSNQRHAAHLWLAARFVEQT